MHDLLRCVEDRIRPSGCILKYSVCLCNCQFGSVEVVYKAELCGTLPILHSLRRAGQSATADNLQQLVRCHGALPTTSSAVAATYQNTAAFRCHICLKADIDYTISHAWRTCMQAALTMTSPVAQGRPLPHIDIAALPPHPPNRYRCKYTWVGWTGRNGELSWCRSVRVMSGSISAVRVPVPQGQRRSSRDKLSPPQRVGTAY